MTDSDKRQPTIADRFVGRKFTAEQQYLKPGITDALQRKVRAARKFALDEKAAVQVARVVRDVPELLIREADFARAPFDLTWIEFPHWAFFQEMHKGEGRDMSADHTIGYLIDGNMVSVVAGGTIGAPNELPYPGVFNFWLNTAWPEDHYKSLAEEGMGGMDGLDMYLWGSTVLSMDATTRAALRTRHSVGVMPMNKTISADRQRSILEGLFKGSVGELRNVIAILLMLNRPTVTKYGHMPASRGWLKNRNIPYAAHTTVTIDIDPIPTLKLIGTPEGEGVAKRRHEVRGHYCHDADARDYRRIAGCAHDWVAADEFWSPLNGTRIADANHWVCDACGGKRWWREAHERGDASRGYVSHDGYHVTAS